MAKPRKRYVAAIVYKGRTPNEDEYDLETLKARLYEDVLGDFEICKKKLENDSRKGRAAIFELSDCQKS